jgi:predicted SprT family Zn-dependent metalloprotease
MELHKAQQLAIELMQQHGLNDWCFRFDRARRRFGCCHLTKKVISLSFRIVELNNEQEVKDTILHEIAHALTPMKGHGYAWRKKCIEIGANPIRCYSNEIITPQLAWQGSCPVCGLMMRKARKPRFKSWHRNCGSIFQTISWKKDSND